MPRGQYREEAVMMVMIAAVGEAGIEAPKAAISCIDGGADDGSSG